LSLSVSFLEKKDNGGIERIPRRSALPDLKRIGVVEMKEKKTSFLSFYYPFHDTYFSLAL
jgi:hypothetical protein